MRYVLGAIVVWYGLAMSGCMLLEPVPETLGPQARVSSTRGRATAARCRGDEPQGIVPPSGLVWTLHSLGESLFENRGGGYAAPMDPGLQQMMFYNLTTYPMQQQLAEIQSQLQWQNLQLQSPGLRRW